MCTPDYSPLSNTTQPPNEGRLHSRPQIGRLHSLVHTVQLSKIHLSKGWDRGYPVEFAQLDVSRRVYVMFVCSLP